MAEPLPEAGHWPVDPQEDQPIDEGRIWIDGCFDFFHHGHAGVMLQARQLGHELLVGIHSDQDILNHKGPTVMNLKERVAAAEACRWTTQCVPHAPYVTQLSWLSHYGCKYVVHGDDITSDSSGEDCYRFAKQAGRFKVVKRTPGISTTDLVGRMLLCTKTHFIKSLKGVLEGQEGRGTLDEMAMYGREMDQRLRAYASDESGLRPGVDVYMYLPSPFANGSENSVQHAFQLHVEGKQRMPHQRLVYVDGGFDLFSSGHIAFLNSVCKLEEEKASLAGWYRLEAKETRIAQTGTDYGPAYVIAGIHDDLVINKAKGMNYPIMNIFERGLCLVQCRFVHAVIFGAPFEPTASFLENLPGGPPNVVYHGHTSFIPLEYDPYTDARSLGVFEEVAQHDFQNVDAGHIVQRIAQSRAKFEARQRAKGAKSLAEENARRKEIEEDERNKS